MLHSVTVVTSSGHVAVALHVYPASLSCTGKMPSLERRVLLQMMLLATVADKGADTVADSVADSWPDMQGLMRGRTFSAPKKSMRGKGRITVQFGCCYNYATDRMGRLPGKPSSAPYLYLCARLVRHQAAEPSHHTVWPPVRPCAHLLTTHCRGAVPAGKNSLLE